MNGRGQPGQPRKHPRVGVGDNDYLTDGYSFENNLQVDELIGGGDRDPPLSNSGVSLSLPVSVSFLQFFFN